MDESRLTDITDKKFILFRLIW